MSIRLKNGRAGVLALVGGALCTLVATVPAQAVCVGDCGGDCVVTVSNMVVGVNIVLGLQPTSNCPAFENASGVVDIAQLVQGVNNLLNNCNPTSCNGTVTDTPTVAPSETPTQPPTATPTETPTEGPTLPPTVTPTATPFEPICILKAGVCVGGNNNGQECTANPQCSGRTCAGGENAGQPCTGDAACPGGTCPPGGTCDLDRRCVGGANNGQPCTVLADCPEGQCPTVGEVSKIELNVAALPVPLSFAIRGEIRLDRGPITDNQAELACTIISIDAIQIPAIGVVCITPATEPCPGSAGTIDCDGGALLGINLLSDGNIGACLSNAACEASCDTYCGGVGGVRQTSGCAGYCSGSTPQPCTEDAICLNDEGCTAAGAPQPCCTGEGTGTCGPANGACNGPDPVGARADICQCQCIDTMAGEASRAGDFQCQLGASLVVERTAPCDGSDVSIAVGGACIPVTTSTGEAQIINANGGTGTLGPFLNTGNPVPCGNYETGPLTGIKGIGVVNFFGSALGDISTELFPVCK